MQRETAAPLNPELTAFLRRRGEEHEFSDGAAIVRRGEPGKYFYVLLSGSAEVRLVGEAGQHLVLRTLGEGSSFGEMSVLTGDPVSADVVASGPVRMLVYPGHLLSAGMAECAPLRERILATLANNLRGASRDVWNFHQRAKAMNVLLDNGARAGPIVAVSRKMRSVEQQIAALAKSSSAVLVTGPAGAGKLYAATKIHQAQNGEGSPFLVIDCRRLRDQESRQFLFGSTRLFEGPGAGSGVNALQNYGTLHLAHGGTLVLRNVEALPEEAREGLESYLAAQARGELEYPKARVIGTTSEDLLELGAKGELRTGVAQALGASTLEIPALKDRRKDILPLARAFLDEREGGEALRITRSAEHVLVSCRYSHGNAAELREALDLAALFAAGGDILAEHIFTGPKDEGIPLEYDLGQLSPVQWLMRDPVLNACRLSVFAFFAAIILVNFLQPDGVLGWFANSLVWGLWWPALIFAFLFVGRVWCIVCPLASAGRVACRMTNLSRPPPGWLKQYSPWIVPIGFLLIVWAEHSFQMTHNPVATGVLLVSLMAGAAAFSVIFEREAWCRYVCPMGNLGAIYSLLATLNVRSNPDVCATYCTTHECHKGSKDRGGCPVFHHPLYARDGHVCKLCFQCLKNCPHGSARLYLRPPLLRIWRQADLGGGLTLFALIVFFVSPLLLASQSTVWGSTILGFTAAAVVAVVAALGLRAALLRLLSPDDPESPEVSRVSFALLVLAWGPASAFHLGNSPFIATLRIGAEPGSFWQSLVPGGVPLLAVLQIGTLVLAGALAVVALWGVRGRCIKDRGSFPPSAWRALQGLCAAYWVLSLGLILNGAVVS